MDIKLRLAKKNDARLLFQWRNDPVAARNSLNSNPIEWHEHKSWFDASLENGNRDIFIAMLDEERPFGMIRLDWIDDEHAEVSINIDPNLRGKGLGRALLKQAVGQFPKTCLFATIKGSNVASLIIFLASGFELTEYNPTTGLAYLMRRPKSK